MGIMKYVFALLLLAGLALAEPEATPDADAAADAWYGYYGHGLGYRRYYGGYYGGYYGRKKREADPAVLATTHSAPAVAPLVHPYGYALGYGYGLHHAPTVGYTIEHKATEHIPGAVTAVAGEPTVVHVAGYGLGYGLWGRKKREADPAVVAVKHAAPTAVIPPPVPLARGENFWPPLPHIFILLNIKEPKLFRVPSLLGQPLLPMLLPTDTDMATDMDSTTPSLLPPLLPQRRPL